ncbi:hypothetical protein [Mycetocola saprophilus]|uniref:hypothetical protein n=1 Tax=Mycetocola saprophilus TaxID=76636 RepID=UPI003BF3AFC9
MNRRDQTGADAGEFEIHDDTELLFRQIIEWMVVDGVVLSTVFGPSPHDRGKPSYSRSSIVTARGAQNWHNAHARSRSREVWAVSVGEALHHELRAIDDSKVQKTGEIQAPGHCFLDFRELTRNQIKERRFRLYITARRRGAV